MRASAVGEKLGLPSVSLVCDGFVSTAQSSGAGLGMPNLPLSAYPGPVNLHSSEEIQRNVVAVMVEQVIKGLTGQPDEAKALAEPQPKDVVLRGNLDEVNGFFYENEWSDGLPVIPPTIERVERFLKYSGRSAGEIIGVLLPDKREATPWNIAVNGVMSGCRPEYMPVLVALVEAMCDPQFGEEHLGCTPGTEALIILNGPIVKDLGFNYEQGALRVGFQANTSIGRFWRMYLRNVAGFLPRKSDKATFGGTWRVVLAENEDALARIGWQPLSVDQGFQAGDNVVTVASCTSTDSIASIADSATPEGILDRLAARIVDIHVYTLGNRRPEVLVSPCIAEAIAGAGYSKARMKQYLWEHAVLPASRHERLRHHAGWLCDAVKQGALPELYCRSTDPDRLVPVVPSPDHFIVAVSGDPGRDNCFVCAQNGFIGFPTSKKIKLPDAWRQLLGEARDPRWSRL